MNPDIHEYLKSIRIEQQLSIQELSKISGVSASHISRIERSNRNPSPQTLEKLAPHLNVSYISLLEVANLVSKSAFERVNLEEVLTHGNLFYKGLLVEEDTKSQITELLKKTKKD